MFVSHSLLFCPSLPSLGFALLCASHRKHSVSFTADFSYFSEGSKEKEGETFHLQESEERVSSPLRVETQWESPEGKQ